MRDKKEIDKLVGGNQADLEQKFQPYCRPGEDVMCKQSFEDRIT
jgi:thioredoxin 1